MLRLLTLLFAVAFLPTGRLTILPSNTLAQSVTPTASPDSLKGVQPLPLTGERQTELAHSITTMLEKTQVPGAAVAIVQNGEVVYLQGFGVREPGGSAPVTPDTLMMIGSVTKSMTATMAATLVDDGDLTWGTPVVDVLPEFAVADPELTAQLTVRDAFCACTGLPQRDADFVFHSDSYSPERLIASVADFPLTAPLGELFQYSNQMFAIGGYAATVAAGGSPDDLYDAYTAIMRRQVLDRIGMPRSTFDIEDVLASGDYAVAHGQNLTGVYQPVALEDEDSFVRSVAPAGALWSSAAEMARYLQTELAGGVAPDGTRVVSAENLHETWQQQVAIPGEQYGPQDLASLARGYGLGWVIGDYRGQPLLWHSGGTFGFSSQMAFLPDADLGLVILSNGAAADDVLTLAIQFRMLELLFDQPQTFDALVSQELESTAQDLAALQTSLGLIDVDAIAPNLGVYHNDALGDVKIALEGGTLVLDLGEVQTAMRPLLDEAGDVEAYLLAEPPLVGSAAVFSTDDGAPAMALSDPDSDEEYLFSFVGDEAMATPTA